MKQILWFRRDLRVQDNIILQEAKDEVLPIFIFDKNILEKLEFDDKRVSFIYKAVLDLKNSLQKIGLDLYIFYEKPIEVFKNLAKDGFDEVLCSIDFDSYAKKRDEEVEKIIPLKRFNSSFLIYPDNHLKKDGTPYKVFTPFYKSLSFLSDSSKLEEESLNEKLRLISYENSTPSLEEFGFKDVKLGEFFDKLSPIERLESFKEKIESYEKNRDLFYLDGTSNLGVDLRFGTLSPKMIFNYYKKLNLPKTEVFIRQLFWRDFFNYILFHFPKSESENFNGTDVKWSQNQEHFEKWCSGETGVPIIDAAMIEFNKTGMMHNRLRMVVASFLTKNLLIDWRWGEKYFASKLLDYDAASNIGSWQWAASTGADAVPYFRVFNPYLQSEKFDKEAQFIKKVIPSLKDINPKEIHKEYGLNNALFSKYIRPIVDIKTSRDLAINTFKEAKNERV